MSTLERYQRLTEDCFGLFNALQFPLAVFRVTDGTPVMANPRFFADFNRPEAPIAPDRGAVRMRIADKGAIVLQWPDGYQRRIAADAQPIRYDGQECWLVAAAPGTARPPSADPNAGEAERYRALVENLNDVVYTTDLEAVVTYVSPNIAQVSGYTPREVIGRNFVEFVHPEDLQDRMGQFLKILGGARQATEYRLITKTGDIKWARTSARPMVRNGAVVGVQGILVDITDRKEVEKALQESEEKYRILVQNSKDAIFVIQGDHIKFMNPSAAEILGYDCEHIAGIPFWEFIHPDDRKMIARRYTLRLQGQGLSERAVFRILNREGEVRDVDLNAVLITWEEKPAVLNFLRDVTVPKLMEKQLRNAQKMEALGTLSGGIAHNFNNLLMGIHGSAALSLQDVLPSSRAHRHLEKIVSLVHSGAKLTHQLLDYARGGEPQMGPVHLNRLVQEASETISATKRQIQIHHRLSDAIPLIKADQGQIEQVLLNLLMNAADAMPNGGEVRIETACVTGAHIRDRAPLSREASYVLIQIADTGTGIPEKIRDRIFEPFFTTKGLGRGTGLGLSTAYGIVKQHKGEICVESEVDRGSTFFVYLPALCTETADPAVESCPQPVTVKGTILLVDDEPAVLDPTATLLERMGYTVFKADSGAAAMTLFERNWKTIDLVILDLIMPHISGRDLYYKLREIDPQVKVLLSTGFGQSDQTDELLSEGCRGLIQKPYDIPKFSDTMMAIMRP